MGESSPPASGHSPQERLDSWKEIAAHLNRDVTTVQRWEKREGMPVHRHLHDKVGTVFAYPAEIDEWWHSRNLRAEAADLTPSPLPPPAATPVPAPSVFVSWKFLAPIAVICTILAIGAIQWLGRTEYFWRNPIADARFQTITDFEGIAEDAAVSRDGQFIAFLSDRDGTMDVWVTQLGSGQFHNLTRDNKFELVNPSVRTLGFSPDGSLVTFWIRKKEGSGNGDISIWAVPTLGGQPRPYLEGVAEFDWSRDGSRLAYHTPGPGDPLFVSDGIRRPQDKPIFTAPAGLHSHFPVWAPDGKFIYFVQGLLPDKLDIWRIRPSGGVPERITSHNTRVTHPVLWNQHTLLYLASDDDGSGPWLYSMDLERRTPHRLTTGLDGYTSLAATADGRRLVVTLARPKRTLWRLALAESHEKPSSVAPTMLTPSAGFSPRIGPDYVVYISAAGSRESIRKLVGGTSVELWHGEGARIFGGPAISSDGKQIAFSVRQQGQALLYAMQADGSQARIVNDSLELQGNPAWMPDGRFISSAANDHGTPYLFQVPVDGDAPAPFVQEYALDPAWAPDGHSLVYSGPDIGTKFAVKAVAANASAPLATMTLSRGARHLAFLPSGKKLLFLRGEIQHKDLWLLDLETGSERQLTSVASDFNITDFDISRDGHQVVLEREQLRSDIVLLDLTR